MPFFFLLYAIIVDDKYVYDRNAVAQLFTDTHQQRLLVSTIYCECGSQDVELWGLDYFCFCKILKLYSSQLLSFINVVHYHLSSVQMVIYFLGPTCD